MEIKFTFKNFEPSKHLKGYAQERFEKIAKYLPQEAQSELSVNLSVEKYRHMAEIILVGKDLHISANAESEDMYSTIDLVLDKLEAQVRKSREKGKDHRRGQKGRSARVDFISFIQGEGGKREQAITATDNFQPKPMSVDEAAMQLETLGNDFLVFFNAEIDRVNVIYRRKSGDFGLIDPGI
ncbi:MAG TPA: ribosome-associated translation inhibitor RaiA [Desulfonatronum sp.]|nr:ribosome-associated translation inhibitor RaiA [Desulfonatronum sp.]